MTISSNKYEAEAAMLRDATDGEVCAVVVAGGNRGDGFSMQMQEQVQPGKEAELLTRTAAMLRGIAHQIDDEALRRSGSNPRERARVLLDASRLQIAMVAYGLGQVSPDFTAPELQSMRTQGLNGLTRALDQLTAASAELDHVLEVMLHRPRGDA